MGFIKIKTTVLQDMVSKVLKGYKKNAMYPITGMMDVWKTDEELRLTTTDGTNFLQVKTKQVSGDALRTPVNVETFSKLILKMTCEEIKLSIQGNSLQVTGNGTYSINLPVDEEEISEYPIPRVDEYDYETVTINTRFIKEIITTNEGSLATTLEYPALTGYFFKDGTVLSTDTLVLGCNTCSVFDKDILLSPAVMNLLSLIDSPEINVRLYENNYVVVENETLKIIARSMDELELYPYDSVIPLIKNDYPQSCIINRNALLNVLDRLNLFVEPYDENGVYLNFDKSGLIVSSKKGNASEKVSYIKNDDAVTPFVCLINIEKLVTQLDAHLGESIKIYYGQDTSIKIESEKVSHIIFLLGEEA